MKLYADTSWWLACKCRGDRHHGAALTVFDRHPAARVFWTPWQRVEVFNSLRQAERHGLLAAGEARAAIRSLEQEVRLGYWPHLEFDWTDAVRSAAELSAEHGLRLTVRAMDLFHLAVAIEVAADGLLSFDNDQIALAKAAGLAHVNLLRDGSRPGRSKTRD